MLIREEPVYGSIDRPAMLIFCFCPLALCALALPFRFLTACDLLATQLCYHIRHCGALSSSYQLYIPRVSGLSSLYIYVSVVRTSLFCYNSRLDLDFKWYRKKKDRSALLWWCGNEWSGVLDWRPISIAIRCSSHLESGTEINYNRMLALWDEWVFMSFLITTKLELLATDIQKASLKYYQSSHQVSINKQLIGFKGRSRYTMTINNKIEKKGIKVYSLCDGNYLLDFLIASKISALFKLTDNYQHTDLISGYKSQLVENGQILRIGWKAWIFG